MNTKFEDVYSLFLQSIDDYELAQVEQDELEEVLSMYLLNCFGHLQEGVRDLSDIDIDSKEFNYEASHVEKLVIAKAMKLEWISTKKSSQELMEKAIGDRDYKAVQGTEYLKELTRVEKALRDEISRTLLNYSYSTEDFFGGLA